MDLAVFDNNKKIVDLIPLEDKIFGREVKAHLLHKLVTMQLNNRRSGTSATKTRDMVSGGGIKPWRQKGTGRARCGSIRSPLWRKGAIIFGPQPREYKHKVPKKIRRQAILHAIISRLNEKAFNIVEHIPVASPPKTKEMVNFIKGLGIKDSILILNSDEDKNLELAVRNIPYVGILNIANLNVYDLLAYKNILCNKGTFLKIKERFFS